MRIKSNKYIMQIVSICILTFHYACLDDVERENPLDPVIGNNSFQLTGQVLNFYHPRSGIPGATIHIQPGDGIAISDQDGFYEIHHLVPGNYKIFCTADGYHLDSSTVTINEDLTQDFFLNGSPGFTEISIRGHHHSRWFPREEIYFLTLETIVTDPDGIGDIGSVICTMPSLGFVDTLQPGIEAGHFSSTLFDRDLPVTSVHQIIGHAIKFEVFDDYGSSSLSKARYITRIIEQTPTLINPTGLQLVEGESISFRWDGMSIPFPATLRIDIFHINLGIALKVEEITDISISKKYYHYNHSFSAGDYFWTLNIVDEFSNSSGSREGTFKIN